LAHGSDKARSLDMATDSSRILATLLCLLLYLAALALPAEALAAPVMIDASSRVATVRTDPGTGLCGTVEHFVPPMGLPVGQISDAAALLDKPQNDASNLGRVARVFPTLNFRNTFDNMTSGDFSTPDYVDAIFPYSSGTGMPAGDNNNIAVRLRGYLNVRDD